MSSPIFKWYSDPALTPASYLATGASYTAPAISKSYYVTVQGTNAAENLPGTAKKIDVIVSDYCGLPLDNSSCAASGKPLSKETFGDTNTTVQTQRPSPPPGLITTYIYNTNVNNASNTYNRFRPNADQYTIVNFIRNNGTNNGYPAWWDNLADHTNKGTANAKKGYYMVVNVDVAVKSIYQKTISNLCPGTRLFFSAWLANLVQDSSGGKVKPNLTFVLTDENSNTIGSLATGNIPYGTANNDWREYGFSFTMPQNSFQVTLNIMNNQPSSIGNDIGLDDIGIYLCSPLVTATSAKYTYCQNDTMKIVSALVDDQAAFGNNVAYRWFYSKTSDTTWSKWTAIGGITTDTVLTRIADTSTAGYYRVVAGNPANIIGTNPYTYGCYIVSDPIQVSVRALPVATFAGDTIVCMGYNTSLKVNMVGQPPFNLTYAHPQGSQTEVSNINANSYIIPVLNVLADSTFTLTKLVDQYGCTTTSFTGKASATAKEIPKPIVQINTSGIGNVCENASIPLSVNITSGGAQTFFRWEVPNGAGSFTGGDPGARIVQYDPALSDIGKYIWIRARYQDDVCVGYYAMDSVQIRVLPLTTGASMEIITEPVIPQTICKDTVYILKIKASNEGALKGINLQLADINSSQIVIGDAYIKYPYDTVNWSATALPIISSDASGKKWLVSDSLKGNDSLQVKVTVTPKCNFSSGKTLQFNFNATDFCGGALPSQQKETQALYTNRDLSNTNTFTIIDTLEPNIVRNNTTDTILWTLKMLVGGTQLTDSTKESVRVFIPKNLFVVPGSFVPVKNVSTLSSLVTDTLSTGIGYSFPIPSGLTNGDTMVATVKLSTTQAACGNYMLQHEVKFYSPDTCDGVPCVSSASLANIQKTITVERYKFSNVNSSGYSFNDTWSGTITVTAINETYVGDTIFIDFYKDMNNNGKLDIGDVFSTTVARPTLGVAPGSIIPLPFSNIPFTAGKQLLAIAYGSSLCDSIILPIVTIDGAPDVCQGDTAYYTMPPGMETYNWKLVKSTVDATTGATPARFIPEGYPGYSGNPLTDTFYVASTIGVYWRKSNADGTPYVPPIYPTGTYTINSWYTLPGVGILSPDSLKVTVNKRPFLVSLKSDTTVCMGQSVDISLFFRDTNNVGTFSYFIKNADNSYTLTNATVTPTDTTVYAAFAVAGSSGCAAFDTVYFKVNVVQLPSATISHDGIICQGDAVDLAITLTQGALLPEWKAQYMEGTTLKPEIINSSGDNTIIITVAPTIDTQYYLKKVVDGNGCVINY